MLSNQRGFTLLELAVVIAIVAVISVAVLITLNPAQLLKQGRDARRLADIAVLNKALSIYQAQAGSVSLATTSMTYVSIPSTSTSCLGTGLSGSYTCVGTSTLTSANGTGWIPVNFLSISGVQSPISALPIDPNNSTTSGFYYAFQAGTGGTWKLSAAMESTKYLGQSGSDGGTDPIRFERGADLSIIANSTPAGSPVLWLAADAIAGVSDGGNITTWADASGNSNNGTATGLLGVRPTYQANIINGKPVVRFYGSSQTYFTFPNFASGFTAGEVFIVVKTTSDPGASNGGLWHFSSDAGNTHYCYADGMIYDNFGTDSRKNTVNPTPSLASWNIYNVSSGAGNWTSRLNGTVIYVTGSNTVAFGTSPKLGESVGGGTDLTGDVAEFILYNSVLDTTTRASVVSYLQGKYGI